MIDEIYNSRIGIIKTDHFSDEWEQTAIPLNLQKGVDKVMTMRYNAHVR